MTYVAPLAEQMFVLETIADLSALAASDRFADATPELANQVLEQSASLASEVFAPINRVGDQIGARFEAGVVTVPPGFADAYARYRDGGWGALNADPAYGGQGLPFVLALAVQEQFTAANMALSLCLILGQGAITALSKHGGADLRSGYLAKLVSGEWAGTMNLTEPQAGSDVGALRTRAEPHADGSYRIKGSKIFISFGEHEMADNIVHLVLARTPDAPAGTKGISLFLVPKFLPDGKRNDVRCVSIEHKMGIHGSPTCTMSFGDDDACAGWLVGPENGGMRAMFSMMNHARINVGLQGVALADRARQAATAYALERVQGRRLVEHPDVRRMLLTMRALTEAIRAITYLNAAALDQATATGSPDAQALCDLLTPITKAYGTDMGVEVTSIAVQVFGGMGFVEETGVAQHYRDIRIAPIYEGTNGIQALDLVGRKLVGGRWRALFDDIRAFAGNGDHPLLPALAALETATEHLLARRDDAPAGATPYLRMFGIVLGGYLLARQAREAQARLDANQGDATFLRAKIGTANFFLEQIVPQAAGLLPAATTAHEALFELDEEQLAA